jgi:putative ABC transport system permease protein
MKKIISRTCFVILIISVILGVGISNIELNRTIYCNEIHMKASEQSYRNRINKYDLDDMEQKLDKLQDKINHPKEYKSDDNDLVFNINVPKYRILFNFSPFDLRFETQNYSFCLNSKIIKTLKEQVAGKQEFINNNTMEIFKNLKSVSNKKNNIGIKLSQYKEKIDDIIKGSSK